MIDDHLCQTVGQADRALLHMGIGLFGHHLGQGGAQTGELHRVG